MVKPWRPLLHYLPAIIILTLGAVALGYGIGANLLAPSPPAATTTTTTTTTITTTVTVAVETKVLVQNITTTIMPTLNRNETARRLVFLGDDMLVVKSDRIIGSGGERDEHFYRYMRFPYSNFTFGNFVFTYLQGKCDDEESLKGAINLLPCGSRLSATLPSYGAFEIPSRTSSITSQEEFQWTSMHIGVINGELETAGLLLVIERDGTRTVYVTTSE